jgi:type VI secretion system protein ImpB
MPNLKTAQHWLDRNRRPRVQITYDVQDDGATVQQELAFVVGVLSDLQGKNGNSQPFRDRKFIPIDQSSFNDVFQKMAPKLELTFDDRAPVQLKFNSLEDFQPFEVANQVTDIKKLLYQRKQLVELLAKLSLDPKLSTQLGAQLVDIFKLYDLKLMTCTQVPTSVAANTVVVAAVTGTGSPPATPVLHFLAADDSGKVVDTKETDNSTIAPPNSDALKNELLSTLLPTQNLSQADNTSVLGLVNKILGTSLKKLQFSSGTQTTVDEDTVVVALLSAEKSPPVLHFFKHGTDPTSVVDTQETDGEYKTGDKLKEIGDFKNTLISLLLPSATLNDNEQAKIVSLVRSFVKGLPIQPLPPSARQSMDALESAAKKALDLAVPDPGSTNGIKQLK